MNALAGVDNKEYEEQQAQILALLKQYAPTQTLERERDLLSGRYRIFPGQPLQELSSSFATAYQARDEQAPNAALYALVYNIDAILRQKDIDVLKEYRHPNLVSLLDSGTIEISTLSEMRYVAILERPQGRPLSEVLASERAPMSEAMILSYILRPLVEVLKGMNKAGISHNRINLKNAYLNNNTLVLGECISEPAGFSQDFIFEPLERVISAPSGKSDHSISSDCYALAVLMLHLLLGFKPFVNVDRENFIESLATKGSYNTLVVQWDISENMQDFFRGLLNDTRRERWDPDSIENWLSGRKFNLISPSIPAEASRAYDFLGQSYYNRKALANAIFSKWQEGRIVMADNRLGKWVEVNIRKPESGEMIQRIATNSNIAEDARHEKQNNELLAKTVILLDPQGPIRFRNISVMVEGIGSLLSFSFLAGKMEAVQGIVQVLDADLPWFWIEQQPAGTDYNAIAWKLQRVRNHLKINNPGFGIERCIYDLNPMLPCQSKLIKRFNVTTLQELIIALDNVAPLRARQDDFMDRHIAGFIASKLDIGKPVTAHELDMIPRLSMNAGLVGLKLLIRAQAKAHDIPVPGLCYWVAAQLASLMGNIHKRSIRKDFQKLLLDAAAAGSLNDISNVLLNPNIFVADYNGFQKAMATYQMRKRTIAEFKNNKMIKRHSRIAGRGIAQTIAYSIALVTAYYTLKSYFHF